MAHCQLERKKETKSILIYKSFSAKLLGANSYRMNVINKPILELRENFPLLAFFPSFCCCWAHCDFLPPPLMVPPGLLQPPATSHHWQACHNSQPSPPHQLYVKPAAVPGHPTTTGNAGAPTAASSYHHLPLTKEVEVLPKYAPAMLLIWG